MRGGGRDHGAGGQQQTVLPAVAAGTVLQALGRSSPPWLSPIPPPRPLPHPVPWNRTSKESRVSEQLPADLAIPYSEVTQGSNCDSVSSQCPPPRPPQETPGCRIPEVKTTVPSGGLHKTPLPGSWLLKG